MHLLMLAQQNGDAAEAVGIIALVMGILLFTIVISFAISIFICLLIYLPYKDVPAEHQKMAPGLVFLLLIPFFNIIWNFIVFLRIPESFQSCFAAQGRTDQGDCGRQIGLWYAICGVAAFVPCVNYIAGPAALVLFIIFLVKIWSLKGQIGMMPAMTVGGGAPPPPGAAPPVG
jgi:hypothetical protein